ncbi:MAG: DUF4367 domain-containing protein, partial [Dethiobacteria bacterium]|nr:DUF4367 domain-containing protein [Dethiobacteria bacterium]
MKKQAADNSFDQLLEYAAVRQLETLADAHPSERASGHKFSPGFEKKMQLLFIQEEKSKRIATLKKRALQIAAALLIFILLSGVTILSVEAWRVRVLNFIIEINEKSTSFLMEEGSIDYSQFPETPGLHLPSYIPDGYTLEKIETSGSFNVVTYKNDGGDLILLQGLASGSSVGIDSEDAYHEQLLVNDEQAYYYFKNDYSTLLFGYKESKFLLGGLISRDEIIRIA